MVPSVNENELTLNLFILIANMALWVLSPPVPASFLDCWVKVCDTAVKENALAIKWLNLSFVVSSPSCFTNGSLADIPPVVSILLSQLSPVESGSILE